MEHREFYNLPSLKNLVAWKELVLDKVPDHDLKPLLVSGIDHIISQLSYEHCVRMMKVLEPDAYTEHLNSASRLAKIKSEE